MSRWLPYPAISAMLLVTWLLLYETLALSHILLGGALAVGGAWLLLRLDAPPHMFKRFWVIVRLLLEVAVDMTRSNIRVACLIFHDKADRRPGFVRIKLSVRSQYGLAVLACIITATPGTSWVAFVPDTNVLVIHVLDLVDDDDWAQIIKVRYEGRLMEIFE